MAACFLWQESGASYTLPRHHPGTGFTVDQRFLSREKQPLEVQGLPHPMEPALRQGRARGPLCWDQRAHGCLTELLCSLILTLGSHSLSCLSPQHRPNAPSLTWHLVLRVVGLSQRQLPDCFNTETTNSDPSWPAGFCCCPPLHLQTRRLWKRSENVLVSALVFLVPPLMWIH